jgi:hypothetical protein
VRILSAGHTASWTSVFDIDTFASEAGTNVSARKPEKEWKGNVGWTDKGQQAKHSKGNRREKEGFERQ